MRHRDSKGHYIKEDYKRSCYACGRTKSWSWRLNHGTDLAICQNCYQCILRTSTRGVKMYDKSERVCYACGGHNEKLKGQGFHKNWYYNKPTRLLLCTNCYNIIFRRGYRQPKTRKYFINRNKRLNFKGRCVIFKKELRTGVCNWCRGIAGIDRTRTALHHDDGRYDADDPLKYTIEICNECHGRETWDLGQMINRWYD